MMKQALILALLCAPNISQAKMDDIHCDDRSRLTAMMQQQVGAERRSMGLRDPETILEVWIEPRTGDWTLIQSYTNGTACIVAMGAHWEDLAPQAERS